MNDGNFAELDCVLARVRRPTREEIEQAERQQVEARRFEEELRRRESFLVDEDSDMGSGYGKDDEDQGDEDEEDEEDDDEILLSPRIALICNQSPKLHNNEFQSHPSDIPYRTFKETRSSPTCIMNLSSISSI